MKNLVPVLCLALLSLVGYSCSKKEFVTAVKNDFEEEDAVLRSLKFLPIENQESFRSMNSGDTRGDIIKVTFQLGRKSRQCKGLGICRIDWSPGSDKVLSSETSESSTSSGNSSVESPIYNTESPVETYLREDGTGGYYLELPLAEVPKFRAESLSLKVEDSLELISNGDDSLKESLVLPSRVYKFDPSVGKNGGYKISLEGVQAVRRP